MDDALFCSPLSSLDRYQTGPEETTAPEPGIPQRLEGGVSRERLARLRDEPQAASAPSPNLLVISDLHLGDSLRPTDPRYLRQLAHLNRALCRFLKHYAKHRVDGRPWRLVVAGDMIDFLHAGLYADGSAPELPPGHREAALVHCSEEASVAWLERVIARERRVFRLLASFVGAGHELVIIKGNHDAQFHFEGVQRRFTELLLELHLQRRVLRRRGPGAEERRAREEQAFVGRITFLRWFYYEPELVYIEHGNQYDAFCSFEHVLAPVDPEHSELEDPISHRTYREFAGLLASLDLHEVDRWKLADYVRWVAGLGPRLVGRLAYTYFASLSWLVRTKRRLVGAARKARAEHLRILEHLGRRFDLSREVLHALDALRERPAGNSVFAGINMLYMDRVFLAAIDLVTLGFAATTAGPAALRAGVAGGVVALSLVAHRVLEGYREVDPHPKLMKMAHKIARLVRVPFVVFGHTHRALVAPGHADESGAERERAGRDPESWYFNTGSWTTDGVGLTHVCILRAEEARSHKAELRRWCLEKHRPLTLEAPIPTR